MTTAEANAGGAAPLGRRPQPEGGVDAVLDRSSEWFNPILIKEARQSLKSRVFVVMFLLVLVLAWGWSFLGIALMTPEIYFAPGGPMLLIGYVWILLFPLYVVIPFSAFHSLASERDDGTYELVSITTLLPRQIVSGRIAVAVLQMLIFLSVLSPCIAFTYLLRGIDLLSLGLLLAGTAGISLLLTAFSLFWASLSKTRNVRIFMAMILLIALMLLFISTAMEITEMLMFGIQLPFEQPRFWAALAVWTSAGASTFLLLFLAAAASITFVSENRSTPLRLAMLAQQTLIIGWGIWYVFGQEEVGGLFVAAFIGPFYWAVMGSLMIAESPKLFQRARRRLPQSFLGRVFLTWLQPGPGTGYVFAVANTWALMTLVVATAIHCRQQQIIGPFQLAHVEPTLLAAACYVTIYLGIGRLLAALLERVTTVIPASGLIIMVFLVTFGCLVPFVLQAGVYQTVGDYSLLQLSNPFWTLIVIGEGEAFAYTLLGIPLIPFALPVTASGILLANLVLAGREVRRLREQAPQRVQEEDAAKMPPPPVARDPLR